MPRSCHWMPLHNYRESYRLFGLEGVLNGYSPAHSKSRELQRRLAAHKRRPGCKAEELAAQRRTLREQQRAQAGEALVLALESGQLCEPSLAPWMTDTEAREPPAVSEASTTAGVEEGAGESAAAPEPSPLPYAPNHPWQASRYAGVFLLILALLSRPNWLVRLLGLFGKDYRLLEEHKHFTHPPGEAPRYPLLSKN